MLSLYARKRRTAAAPTTPERPALTEEAAPVNGTTVAVGRRAPVDLMVPTEVLEAEDLEAEEVTGRAEVVTVSWVMAEVMTVGAVKVVVEPEEVMTWPLEQEVVTVDSTTLVV